MHLCFFKNFLTVIRGQYAWSKTETVYSTSSHWLFIKAIRPLYDFLFSFNQYCEIRFVKIFLLIWQKRDIQLLKAYMRAIRSANPNLQNLEESIEYNEILE